jgi:tRNA(Arg) A34 adenosine deaminase TadA
LQHAWGFGIVAGAGRRVQGLGPDRPGQNATMTSRLRSQGLRRRRLLATLAWLGLPALAADSVWREAMRRAEALRDEAVRAGDQPFGAVVLRGDVVVGAAPSRVVTATDPTAHAEMEAIRDAARRLGSRNLAGCVLVSTSRPCPMCEAAAGWAGIARMVYGQALTDGGAPR